MDKYLSDIGIELGCKPTCGMIIDEYGVKIISGVPSPDEYEKALEKWRQMREESEKHRVEATKLMIRH